ncbi:MAG: hypothetical protein IJX98_06485 [Clostridia bacterium]|nr:hypothetical protein [Clostridia bacterium]
MKIYFLSALPCALYIGGAYFGITDRFERFAEICLKDGLPVRFEPANAQPLSLFLTETLPIDPPAGTEVYLLPDGIAVYAYDFPPKDSLLTPIAQKRLPFGLVSVYFQGGVQVSIESEKGFFNAHLPPCFSTCAIHAATDTIALLEGDNAIALFNGDGEKILEERCLSFSLNGDTLTAVLPLSDRFARVAECEYLLQDGRAIRSAYTLKTAGKNEEDKNGLIAYAFFESVRIGATQTELLSEELKEKSGAIEEFLGNFLHVLPTDDPCVCRFVYPKSPRLFLVRQFTATVENGKITDIVSDR